MHDRDVMENLLGLEKGVCDLYMHGAIESSTDHVHGVFSSALNESLGMQSQIYSAMESRGWYSAENAEQHKVEQIRQKFGSR
ncbi:MAG: spore coat protein [Ruminococcus sp.]|nr:spore coat protein [Ruminococcus sp.]